jgi:hypothetical protein
MRRTVLISVFILGLILLLTLHAVAQNKVVVIPLFGDEQQALRNPAPVEKTGQTTSYATGDDGDLEKGIDWPNPRFTDNGDGTVTDNLTGLIWLQDAGCINIETWLDALTESNGLANGSCGLTDGSVSGDWRLPHIKELQSLCDYGRVSPAFPSEHPFKNIIHGAYWSSTTRADDPEKAWNLSFYTGWVNTQDKTSSQRVWPVRGGN